MKILMPFLFLLTIGCVNLLAQDAPYKELEEKEVYLNVENMPIFPGCDVEGNTKDEKMDCTNQEIVSFIIKNLKYPKEARQNKIEGNIITKFVINKDGSMGNIWVAKDIGNNCDEAAREVLIAMAKLDSWTPGMQRGKAVKVQYTLPFTFKL